MAISYLASLRRRSVCVVALALCLCVFMQMLGAPVTLLGLLTSDTPVESFSEDFSILPIMPEPAVSGRLGVYAECQPSLHFPIFSSAVFHPPQA